MITIRPDSWHYRMWRSRYGPNDRIPTHVGICNYYWAVVSVPFLKTWNAFTFIAGVIGALILALALMGLVVGLAILCLKGLYTASTWAFLPQNDLAPSKSSGLSYLYFVLVLLALSSIIWGLVTLKRKWRIIKSSDTVQLTSTFLRAKKERICPIIELPDPRRISR